jgi:Mn-dependent DtxR family transcriptional regulator
VDAAKLTRLQGQYVSFIYHYSRVNGRAPAEADIQRYFGVTPPAVHDMILRLEQAAVIARTRGVSRSIRLLVDPETVPRLE